MLFLKFTECIELLRPFLKLTDWKSKTSGINNLHKVSLLSGPGYGQPEPTQFGTITTKLTIERPEVFQENYRRRKLSCHVNVINEHLST